MTHARCLMEMPDYVAPDEIRCGALVPGHPSWAYVYARTAHRCFKRAEQMRGATQVCHVHARAKRMTPWREDAK